MSYTFRGIQLPAHLQESIDAWVEHGRPTGDFLRACIENNLSRAFSYADETNIPLIPAIVGYLYNECPRECWGGSETRREWIHRFANGNPNRTQQSSCERVGEAS